MIGEILLNGGDQVRHAAKDATANALVGDLAEPAFDQVQPRTRSRDEMQMKSWMASDPGFDARVLVGSVVIHDQVQVQPRGCFAVDLFEEANELLMPVTWHAVADNLPIEHAQSGKQGSRAVALVVVRHGPAAPLLDRQSRLRPIEGLDLAFLVDAQDESSVRGIQIEANDIGKLLDEVLVAAELEGFGQMGLEIVLLPNSSNRGFADPLRLRHGPSAPMSRSGRLRVQGGFNDGANLSFRNARDAPRARSVFLKAGHSQREESLSPQLHGWPRDVEPLCDSLIGHAVSGHRDDLRALDDSQCETLCVRPRGQRGALRGRQKYRWGEVHDA